MGSLFHWLIRVMVNLKFAVGLLSTIGLVSIVATVLGGMYGEELQMRIFMSPPFSALMVVFMFALALAVASRWPWKKTHTGWIMTHAGLIIICCGHLATCHGGREGRVDLFEGQATNVMEQDEWLLTADVTNLGSRATIKFPLEQPIDVPLAGKSYGLPGGDTLVVERFWPTYNVRTSVEPDYTEGAPKSPALFVELSSGGHKARTWLLVDDPEESAKQFGQALRLFHQRLPDRAAVEALLAGPGATGRAAGKIVAVSGDAIVGEVPVELALETGQPVAATGFQVRIHRKFDRFRLVDKTPTEGDSGELNPALLLEISDASGRKEHRWVFAAHGEVTGDDAMSLPFELRYIPGGAAGDPPPASVVFLEAEGSEPVALILEPDGTRRSSPVAVGRTIALPWLGAEAKILERHERARPVHIPWCSSYSANRPALRVRVQPAGKPETAGQADWVVWNGENRPTVFQGSSGPIEVRYGSKKLPFGFTLQLKDFVLQTYEGTDNPMSFESFVRVTPHDGRPPFDYHIYMNHPLTFEGHTFFQSSYDPETLRRSIFQVSYDPGWPVVYTGYTLTVLGLFFIVYLKPIIIRREAARLAAAGLARASEKEKSA